MTTPKTFTVLENNPVVMKTLSTKLGFSPSLTFHDIYSFSPPDLTHIPRPVLALLAVIPPTPAFHHSQKLDDDAGLGSEYHATSPPPQNIVWFKQTINDACGSYGLIHCLFNGPAKRYILPGGLAERLIEKALPLNMEERAKMLYDDEEFEEAHQACGKIGDTVAPEMPDQETLGHFIAFVKVDGRLWEFDGARKGPICRGELGEEEDVLSEKGLGLGLGRIMEVVKQGNGDVYFSCVAVTAEEGS